MQIKSISHDLHWCIPFGNIPIQGPDSGHLAVSQTVFSTDFK